MNTTPSHVLTAALLLGAAALPAQNPPAVTPTRAAQIQNDIRYLASDALAGRLAGSPGNDSAPTSHAASVGSA